jgi:signal transduction histidine kinase
MFLKNRISNPNSLAARLTLWYASSLLLLFGLLFFSLYVAMATSFDREMNEDLLDDVEELQDIYQEQGIASLLREVNQEILTEDPDHFFIRLSETNGNVILQSDLSGWSGLLDPYSLYQILLTHEDEFYLHRIKHESLEVQTITGLISDDLIIYLGESMEAKTEVLTLLLTVSLVIFTTLLPIGVLIGRWMSSKAVSGIKEVSRAADKIAQGSLDFRVDLNAHGDEVIELIHKFNDMADQIRKLISEMREMTDNIAHDLRSPLARIRAISETVLSSSEAQQDYKKAASDTLEECDRLLHMINMTLDVAEAEANVREPITEDVNLSELTEDACELYCPLAETKQIKLSTHLEDNCSVRGNKHTLQRMLTNLIDNAVKYTPEHGEILIELCRSENDAVVTIADTGIGIPDPEKQRIFDRFYRCDQSRTQEGCGLGLSYSRAVARAHGGDITLQAQPSVSASLLSHSSMSAAMNSVFVVSLPASVMRN